LRERNRLVAIGITQAVVLTFIVDVTLAIDSSINIGAATIGLAERRVGTT
jgi:hypothetical protein